MNQQFIQSLSIDWNKIEDDSYLREIEAINKLKEVVFEKPITFFVGENGSGHTVLIRKAALKIILFRLLIHILNCIMLSEFQKDFVKQNGDIFLEQKAFIMLQQKNWSIRIGLIHQRNTMKNHTERAFLQRHMYQVSGHRGIHDRRYSRCALR
jgi:ABC-type cobalamin/Fe3+-siderophores transport system ATPase subunit